MKKVCNTCNEELDIRFFHKQGGGHRGKCSICYSTYRREMGWEKKRYERKKETKCKIKTPQSVKYRVSQYAITFNTKEK